MHVQTPSRLLPVADQQDGENSTPALLRLEDLSVAFNEVPAVHSVNLSIRKGEALGLVGAPGFPTLFFLRRRPFVSPPTTPQTTSCPTA